MEIISTADAMPAVDGRYTVFVTDPLQRRWATPMISVWHNGRFDCTKPVYAWIGPWPTGLVDDLWPLHQDAYATVARELAEHIDAGILASVDREIGKSAALGMAYGEAQEYDL